jgi:hypothetical protein
MRGQRYSRHAKNCWRHFLQTRNSRRRFQVAMASKIYPVFASYENTGVHPLSIAIPKMGKQLEFTLRLLSSRRTLRHGGFMGQPSRLHVPSREAS